MSKEEFSIVDLYAAIIEILPEEFQDQVRADKLMSLLNNKIDSKLVPANFNNYTSKKKKEKWTKAVQLHDKESSFWRLIVKDIFPDDIQTFYDKLDQLLIFEGLKKKRDKDSLLTCFYCERVMDAASFGGEIGIFNTIDHIIAKSKGGSNYFTNLVNACNECNTLKSNFSLPVFINKLETSFNNNIRLNGIPVELYPNIIKNVKKLMSKAIK